MANALPRRVITPRDLELLAALDYGPLTARQLQKLSSTWPVPFTSARSVRDRLQRLAHARLVTGHPYAILHPGQPEHYYLPTRSGFGVVHGPDSTPPTRGYFSPVALARQPHQRAIANHQHPAPKNVAHYILAVAKLGGYLARKNDGPPGNTVLWRGIVRLNDIHLGFSLDREVGN